MSLSSIREGLNFVWNNQVVLGCMTLDMFTVLFGGAVAVLDDPAHGVSPGQACVLYDGDRVLGGGWIQREAGSGVA